MAYRQAQDVVTRRIADEVFLVPVRGKLAEIRRMFVLNPVGEYIWDHLDGSHSRDEIVAAVLERFDVDELKASSDVDEFLVVLEGLDLVQEVLQ
jgi:hypothetical protein